MYKFEFTLQGLPPTTNSMGRKHWAVKARVAREWKAAVYMRIGNNRPKKPLLKARVTITRHSTRECDFDNLVSASKHLLDGLKYAGIILDDKVSVIGQPIYLWEKAKRGQGKVTIKVEEIGREAEKSA